MSTVYFLAYCAAMKNRPRIYPRAILPSNVAHTSNLMWEHYYVFPCITLILKALSDVFLMEILSHVAFKFRTI